MHIIPTDIPDVLIVEPKVFEDDRGFFMESWNRKAFEAAGIASDFVQDNHSQSKYGTLRGLHYQIQQAQGKLVRVTRGSVFDVAVDIRHSSPTFGQWVGIELSEVNKRMLWVPGGFAHGFFVTSDVAEFQYKCTDYFAPEYERAIIWNDADLNIKWPMDAHQKPVLSAKDSAAPSFKDAVVYT